MSTLIITKWLTLAGITLTCFLFVMSEMQEIRSGINSQTLVQEQRNEKLYKKFITYLNEDSCFPSF